MCRYVSFYIFSFCDRRLFLSLCIRLAPRGNKSEEGELLINSMYSLMFICIYILLILLFPFSKLWYGIIGAC